MTSIDRLRATALPALLAALCTNAGAQPLPKQFDFEVTYTFAVASSTPLALGEQRAAVPMSLQMVAINDKGLPFMHQMFGICAGSSLNLGGSFELTLGCTYEDKDGDRLFETARSVASGSGKLVFIGGTGKFAGMQCEGSFKGVAASKDGSKGIGRKTGSAGCRSGETTMKTTTTFVLAASLLAGTVSVAAADDTVLVHRFTIAPRHDWTTVSIELSPHEWRVGGADGAAASDAQLRALLGDLGAVEIGGRCASWVDVSTVYPCGFAVELIDFGDAVQGPYPITAFDLEPPGADGARAAAQTSDALRRSPLIAPVLAAPRFVAVRLPRRYLGDQRGIAGRRLEFRVRASSNALVPSQFDRGSGLVILRPGALRGDGI